MRVASNLMVGISLLIVPTLAHAQEKIPLRFAIAPRGLTARSGAPVDAEVELRWGGTRLLEGRLELTIYYRQRVVGRYHSDEIAMSEGDRTFRVMLPPMKNFDAQLPLDVVPRFLTADQAIDLGEAGDFQIRVPPEWKRAFVIAACEPPEPGVPGMGVLPFDALRLEQFVPDYSLETGMGTTVVTIAPQDMPADGLNFFSYDLVVLAGEGFSQLKPKQLSAVADWVEAGGSAIVVPDRNLEDAHVQFLNRMARAVPGESTFIADANGRLPQSPDDVLANPTLSEPGLGRAVILGKPLDNAKIAQPTWRRIVGFLWKVRHGEMEYVAARNGKWSEQGSQAVNTQSPYTGPAGSFQYDPNFDPTEGAYRPFRLTNSFELQPYLTPSGIRIVPLSLVATVLTLFLLAIGPGDYYLLGLLRARKYTWILFPLVAIGFTAFMVVAAQGHMGSNDYRNSLVFVDLGDEGKAVRTSRFELIFTATQKAVDTELSDCLFARFDPPRPELYDDWMDPNDSRQVPGALPPPPDSPWVENRMPTSFLVRDELQKWSPKLNRYTSLGSSVDVPDLDWDAVGTQIAAALKSPEWMMKGWTPGNKPPEGTREWEPVIKTVLASFPDAEMFLLHGGDRFIDMKRGFWAPHITGQQTSSTGRDAGMLALIREISAPPRANLLRCVAQISPTGAGDFEDLALYDATDSGRQLLLIATHDGDDWIVYRKLFRIDE